jgi:hypothetical protein
MFELRFIVYFVNIFGLLDNLIVIYPILMTINLLVPFSYIPIDYLSNPITKYQFSTNYLYLF